MILKGAFVTIVISPFSGLTNAFNLDFGNLHRSTLPDSSSSTFDFRNIFNSFSNSLYDNAGRKIPVDSVEEDSPSSSSTFDFGNILQSLADSFNTPQQSREESSSSTSDLSSHPFSSLFDSLKIILDSSPFLQGLSRSSNTTTRSENPLQSLLANMDLETPLKSLGELLDMDLVNPYKVLMESLDFGDQVQLTPDERDKMFADMDRLGYGSECSWEAEEYRQNIIRTLHHSNITNIFQEDFAAGTRLVRKLGNDIIANYKEGGDQAICPSHKLLVCEKESQKCVCGDAAYEAILGINRSLYTLEDDRKCRWNTGSYCHDLISGASFERMFGMVDVKMELECRAGSTCKTKNGEVCSITSMKRVWEDRPQSSLSSSPLRNTQGFFGAMTSGKLCSCKENEEIKKESAVGGFPTERRNFRSMIDLWKNMTRDSDNFS